MSVRPVQSSSSLPLQSATFRTTLQRVERLTFNEGLGIVTDRSIARCVSLLGTASDVGKSIVVTALCRIFSDLGVRVAPYKAQNMSNNSFVTAEGGEMGRAQIVQAQAARVEPHTDMNPVLLKPSADTVAQVVLHGKVIGDRKARDYFRNTDNLFEAALESLGRLRGRFDLIVMEGAGSCAEVNLRPRDFVNFRMAHAADAPVILVADIDRGGVFAQIVGTLDVLPDEDRERVRGFVINRFRGDAALFDDGISYIERRTGLPVLGLIPFFRHIEIDSEDGMPLDVRLDPAEGPEPGKVSVAVLRLPHISNFTDFNPLEREPSVALHYLSRPRRLDGYDIFILPGSKNVRFDLGWMRTTGWDRLLVEYERLGGAIVGICGGYQMLGRLISDPYGVEGDPGATPGLALLDAETTLHREKTLTRSRGVWLPQGTEVDGYEIHMGVTEIGPSLSPTIRVESRNGTPMHECDGAMRSDGRVWGTYFHGLFDEPVFRRAFLRGLRPDTEHGAVPASSTTSFRDQQYDLLAEHFRSHLDIRTLCRIVGLDALHTCVP